MTTTTERTPALLSRDPEIMDGELCVTGTRIPVRSIKSFADDGGYSPEDIQREYPTLTVEQIEAALAHPAPKPEGEAQPYGWSWRQLMHDYQGGWESKMERSPPGSWVKAEDIKDLTPLYAHPAPEPVDREALVQIIRDHVQVGEIGSCSIELIGHEEAADAILALQSGERS